MKIVFKRYEQDQLTLLPQSLEELIPADHLVRVVNETIEKMNINPLIEGYKGGGTSSYHPKMMLKVIVYAYTQKIYSSRRISKAFRENINFMWISGNNRPDHRTINNFRSSRLKESIDKVFSSTLGLLVESGLVKLEDYYYDGSKLEADANKYSYVWKKTVARNKLKVEEKIRELIKHIDKVNAQEEKEYGDNDLEELGENSTITSEKILEKVKELDAILKQPKADGEVEKKEKSKQMQKIKKDLEKKHIPKLQKYEDQERKLGTRNSYSKTDIDSTFMQSKGNGFGNKELKPCYNIQIGTENQFIVGYSIHQNASDSVALPSHFEKLKEILGRLKEKKGIPTNIIADAGYGSEENYEYLEGEGVNAFVKYNTFDKEKTRKYKEDIFRVENLQYEKEKDEYICPDNKRLKYLGTKKIVTANGYETERRSYQSEDCNGCKLRQQCHKSKDNRIIQVSYKLNGYRAKARELLNSEIGKHKRKMRSIEVETIFGDIKHNREFRRFKLRGLKKTNTELGIVSIAHNMIKSWTNKLNNNYKNKIATAY